MVTIVKTTKTAQAISAYWLQRLARPQWNPVAVARKYSAITKNPTIISPIRPMYFHGYMLPRGIWVFSPPRKERPIWGIRSASAGMTLRIVKSAVNPRPPTASLRKFSIGLTEKRSLWAEEAVEATPRTAIQEPRRRENQAAE